MTLRAARRAASAEGVRRLVRVARDRAARRGGGGDRDVPASAVHEGRTGRVHRHALSRRSSGARGRASSPRCCGARRCSYQCAGIGSALSRSRQHRLVSDLRVRQRRAAAALPAAAHRRREDGRVRADRARGRLGREGHPLDGRAQERLVGAERTQDVHHVRAVRRLLHLHVLHRPRARLRGHRELHPRPRPAPGRRRASAEDARAPLVRGR